MDFVTRTANINDTDLLVRLRLDYLAADWGELPDTGRAALAAQLRPFFAARIADETCVTVIAEKAGPGHGGALVTPEVAAFATILFSERFASPKAPDGRVATVYNVLTYPAYRRQGLARRVLGALIDEARARGVSLIELEATADGRPLYERLGFTASDHYTPMSLSLR
ncbi:MAG: GNAT family N-acetyltransferase [Coriobacteriales bacterium]|jgi:GNAT superfamily N-acetyltransferase|nr:GNAT family N-acetyltransferase [Coriobacteriales bacterium]